MRDKHIEIYQDVSDRWRWRIVAANSRNVAASEQGYKSYRYALLKAKAAGGLLLPVVRVAETEDDKPSE